MMKQLVYFGLGASVYAKPQDDSFDWSGSQSNFTMLRSGGIERGINGDLYTQNGLYLKTYASQVLAEWVDNDGDVLDAILSHGCYCAKLDRTNGFAQFLGGTSPLDELDEICKGWLMTRNCNDNLVGGSCEADRETMRTGDYLISIDRSNYDNSACGFTDPGCALDTCNIDLKYVKLLRNFVNDNPGFTTTSVTSDGACPQSSKDKRERKCEGTIPDVYPKKMHAMEQLWSRANWNDEDPADRVEFFNNRKEIQIEAFQQVIVFGWDNVESITFETRDDFNPYYVGWVEKADIDNFQQTETLGHTTKGGAKTVGLFSGSASITDHDGMTQDGPSGVDFFDKGDTVTLTRTKDGSVANFYVNNQLYFTHDLSDWNNWYPAVDTTNRLMFKVIEVVYDDTSVNTTPAPEVVAFEDLTASTTCAVVYDTDENSSDGCIIPAGTNINTLPGSTGCAATDVDDDNISRVWVKDGCALRMWEEANFGGQRHQFFGTGDFIDMSSDFASSIKCAC